MTKSCNTDTGTEAWIRRAFYRQLCDSPQGAGIPLFAQAWWLDAACPKAWTVLTCPDRPVSPDCASETAYREAPAPKNVWPKAAMPVHTPYGNTVQPALFSQHTSIWISPDNQTKEHKILRELAEALSRYRYVYVQFPTTQREAIAFYWKGLALNVRYSYRLEKLSGWREQGGPEGVEEALRAGMGRDSRRRLRLAEAQGIAVRPCSSEEMLRLYRQTFAAQGIRKGEAETACLKRLIETALDRRQGLLWGGYDAEGRLLSAAFVSWQGRTAYYVAGGSLKTKPPHAHAQTLVLFKAIVHCASFCDIFDFEGSMVEGIAQFFQGFGAVPRPYIALCGRQPGLWTRARRKIGRRFRSRPPQI